MKKPKFEVEYVKREQAYGIKALMPNGKYLYYHDCNGFIYFETEKEAKYEIRLFKYFCPAYGFTSSNIGYIQIRYKKGSPSIGVLLTIRGNAYKNPENYLEDK